MAGHIIRRSITTARNVPLVWVSTRSIVHNAKGERDLQNFLAFYSARRPSHITMKEMFDVGAAPTPTTLLLSAQFLHEDIPIRLAQRVRQLQKLPMGLSDMPGIISVRHLYERSFRTLQKLPKPVTMNDEKFFTEVLSDIKEQHNNLQNQIAEALQDLCAQHAGIKNSDRHGITHFLDRFYSSRIAMRLLVGQHIALHEPKDGFVGMFEVACSMRRVLNMAIDAATELCCQYYGVAPEVEFSGSEDLVFTYAPTHLYYVLFELLKNSMRATAEYHEHSDQPLPALRIVLAEGHRDVCLKISDRGGGISRDRLSMIWDYAYTTASLASSSSMSTPMAGYGNGLPLARLYCRYFGGNLQVLSLEGYGTDVFVYFNKVGDTIDESLANTLNI